MSEVKKLAENAHSRMSKIIELFGPRLCGDDSTHKAADYLSKELDPYCSYVKKEEFKVHPDAFLGWIKAYDIVFVITIIINWLNLPIISTVLVFCGIITLFFEFVLYYHFSDWHYPSRTGINVYGVVDPKEAPKQAIIFSGHHDSAHRFSFYETFPNLTIPRCALHILSYPAYFGILCYEDYILIQSGQGLFDAFGTIPQTSKTLNLVSLIFIAILLSGYNFILKEGTPGAGDNLISSSIAVELAKYFNENKLKNTRLYFVSFDGEECGLRGARAFFDKHEKEFKEIPTYNFNVDSPFLKNEFTLLKSDINGLCKLDHKLVDEIAEIGKKCDIHINKKNLPFMLGGTDAAEAARHGISATTLVGLPWTVGDNIPAYHTYLDTPDIIKPEPVEGVLTLAMNYFIEKDKSLD